MSDPIRSAEHLLRRLPSLMTLERERRALSLRQAAEQIGVSKTSLSAFERDRLDPGIVMTRKFLNWLAPPPPLDYDVPLTPAAYFVLKTLRDRDGLGQAWLRLEVRTRGLIVPDDAGTLGELTHIGSYSKRTIEELMIHRLIHLGTIALTPPMRGPRNRAKPDMAWPLNLTRKDDNA